MSDTRAPQTLAWPLLVELVCTPLPTDVAVRGTIRTNQRELWFVHAPDASSGSTVVATPESHADRDRELTALVQGDHLRLDSPTGEPYLIVGDEKAWFFHCGHEVPEEDVRDAYEYDGFLMSLVTRPSYDRFVGNDFAKPDGPVVATTYLGRPAWSLALKPPPHKPHPLHWIVDAETGILLRQANEGFGVVAEWTAFEVIDPGPEEVFEWTGPARTADDRAAEWAVEQARRAEEEAERLAGLGLADLTLAVTARPRVHVQEMGEDGSFTVALRSPEGLLSRRPVTEGPRDRGDGDRSFHHTWREHDWRWDLWLDDGLTMSDEQFARFRASLAATADG